MKKKIAIILSVVSVLSLMGCGRLNNSNPEKEEVTTQKPQSNQSNEKPSDKPSEKPSFQKPSSGKPSSDKPNTQTPSNQKPSGEIAFTNGKTYTTKDGNLSLRIPENEVAMSNPDLDVAYVFADTGLSFNIVVEYAQGLSLEGYTNTSTDNAKETMSLLNEKLTYKTLKSGVKGSVFEWNKSMQGQEFKGYQFTVMNDGYAYILTFVTLDDNYNLNADKINKMIESIVLN